MTRSPLHIACASLSALAFCGMAAAQEYDVFPLPLPAGWTSMFPLALNDHGHAVGIDTDGFFTMPRGFYFDGETAYEFAADFVDSLPYESWQVGVRPLDINNENHVLFTLEILDVGGFSYVWDGENFTEIDPDIPGAVGASAMNNHGILAGTYNWVTPDWNLENRAWIYDPHSDQTTIIEPPAPFQQSVAYAISDTGHVTGYVFGGPVATGFIWKDGDMTLFEGIDEDDYLSISQRINDDGYAGAFTTNNPEPGTPSLSRVYLWSEQGVHEWAYPLGDLTGFQVSGINNNKEVVGTMIGPQQPFRFHNGVLVNLNDQIESPDPDATLDLWDAYDINEYGQIVSHGQFLGTGDWNNYGFILSPKIDKPTNPADLNGDGVVDVLDLLILLEQWGPCGDPDDCPADLNDNGVVDVIDLLILLENWG